MFTMQRYLQMGTLNKQKLHHFDSWAATFGEPVTAMELAPDGAGYRLNTRFARFINVPELMQMFCQVFAYTTNRRTLFHIFRRCCYW
jgi:N12 class adenine-specific DNA methylase